MPLEALPGQAAGSYLIEEYTIALVPVPQLFGRDGGSLAREGLPPSLLLVGDVDYMGEFPRLPSTGVEIAAIARYFHSRYPDGRLLELKGARATETAFRREAPRYRWLHVATHNTETIARQRQILLQDVQRNAETIAQQILLQNVQRNAETIARQIQIDNQRNQSDRWRILQDTQSKIFEIQQDVSINQARTADKMYEKWDEFIRYGDRDGDPAARPRTDLFGASLDFHGNKQD